MDKKTEFVMLVGIGALTRDQEEGTHLAGTAMSMAGYVKPDQMPDNESALELSVQYLDKFYGRKHREDKK